MVREGNGAVGTWQKFEQLGADLEEGQVADHAVLLSAAAKQAQHLLHGWWRPLALPGRVHLHSTHRMSDVMRLSQLGAAWAHCKVKRGYQHTGLLSFALKQNQQFSTTGGGLLLFSENSICASILNRVKKFHVSSGTVVLKIFFCVASESPQQLPFPTC